MNDQSNNNSEIEEVNLTEVKETGVQDIIDPIALSELEMRNYAAKKIIKLFIKVNIFVLGFLTALYSSRLKPL